MELVYRAVSPFYALNLRVTKACGMAVSKCSEERSERFLHLNVEDKKRYLAKISLIGGKDPYALPKADFSQDPIQLPSLR